MEENSNQQRRVKGQNKSFWNDKKNIAILVLAVLLFFSICGYSGKTDVTEYESKISSLNSKIEV